MKKKFMPNQQQKTQVKTKVPVAVKISLVVMMLAGFALAAGFIAVMLNINTSPSEPAPSQKAAVITEASYDYMKFSIDPTIHNNYGLAYPVTYEFDIPGDATDLIARKRYAEIEDWVGVEEKTSGDYFNGVEAAHFDYENDKAYISVAFSDYSDEFHLKIVNDLSQLVNAVYVGIPMYYDNRDAVVTASADDWGRAEEDEIAFQQACDAFIARQMWFSPGIITQGHDTEGDQLPDWTAIQSKIDQGYIEPASHSRNHPVVPYGDQIDSEIGGSKQDIIDNLDNIPYSKGTSEYVYAWIQPYGGSDAQIRQKLGQYKYLSDRRYRDYKIDFSMWDTENNLYLPVAYAVELGEMAICDWCSSCRDDAVFLNWRFDVITGQGKIYHLITHPRCADWTPGSYAHEHLDYISGRNNMWYVGFGHLYLYHYVQDQQLVTYQEVSLDLCGDVNHSGNVDIDDIVYLVEYIFSGGPAPDPLMIGDADASGNVDIDDVMYIVNYIFAGGPEPDCGSRATLAPDPTKGWTLGEINQYIEDVK